jgi:hypothetical protein
MEMVAGGRDGELYCLSGGYDTTSTPTGYLQGKLHNEEISVKIIPNPSNGIFKVQIKCMNEEFLTFTLSDLQGRSSKELLDQRFSAGLHEIPFNATSFKSSGIYILEVRYNKGTIRKKVILTDL